MMIACSLPFYAQLSASSPTKPAQANTPTTPRLGLQKRAATEEAGDSASDSAKKRSRGFYKSFTFDQKIEAAEFARIHRVAARHFDVAASHCVYCLYKLLLHCTNYWKNNFIFACTN